MNKDEEMNELHRKFQMVNKILVLLLLGIPLFGNAQQSESSGEPYRKTVINEGIQVNFSLDHVDEQKTPGVFKEGDDIRFKFSISDTLTQNGLSGAYPAAWMDPIPEVDDDCVKKVATFITGSILKQAELNLNVYYVLTLNVEPSITVVDPLFGYGGSQLLAFIELNSPGMDWVVSKDQNYVFVSMPEAKQIAVISTANWKVINNIDVQAPPHKLALQSDGQYLWVLCQGDKNKGESSGLAVIDVDSKSLKKFIPGKDGEHDLLVQEDDRIVYVSNKQENSLSVIDAHTMQSISKISTCAEPSAIGYSSEAGAVYVISETTGGLTIIDAEKHTLIDSVQLEPGICQIKFEPTQRFGFIVNPNEDNVSIFDASINRVVQVGDMESEPYEVNFTQTLAYVTHRNSELVLMIPLANIGNENLPVTVVDFPGGQFPPGRMTMPCLASGLVQAPGESAVLLANAPDKTIYFYSEGMAAPMGNFSNYNMEPRAVMVIDRSLQEASSGNYETVAKLRSPGYYDVAFFMDVPRFIHCFKVKVLPNPELEKKRSINKGGALTVNHMPPRRYVIAGEEFPINFNLVDKQTNQLMTDLSDVQIMCMGISGSSHFRKSVQITAEGTYSTNVVFSEPGVYYMYVESRSGGLALNNPQYRTIHVISPSSN
ncbi:MAG: YVTN family beta-propeller protein [Saprospiraceae bacterium]|jgi:YVTN family beta-propeller protein